MPLTKSKNYGDKAQLAVSAAAAKHGAQLVGQLLRCQSSGSLAAQFNEAHLAGPAAAAKPARQDRTVVRRWFFGSGAAHQGSPAALLTFQGESRTSVRFCCAGCTAAAEPARCASCRRSGSARHM